MGNGKKKKELINKQTIKQLLNFVEKKCEVYDVSELYASVLASYGGNKSRLISLNFFIDSDNKSIINAFIGQKGKESAIHKRLKMALVCFIAGQKNDKHYEVEYIKEIDGIRQTVGTLKFHSQENVRIICKEYKKDGSISIVMVESCKKKVEKNTGKYQNRLEAAARIRYYYFDNTTGIKTYL